MLSPVFSAKYFTLIFIILFSLPAAHAQDCLDYTAYPDFSFPEAGSPEGIVDIAITGNTLYAASGVTLLIFLLENPLVPQHTHTFDLGNIVANLCITDDLLFLSVDDDGLRIYDITNRTAPALLNTIARTGTEYYMQIRCIVVQNNVMAYNDFDQPVKLMDISDPLNLVELGTIDHIFHDLAIEGNYLGLAGSSLRLYDISNPAEPIELGSRSYFGGCYWYRFSFGGPVIYDDTLYAEHKYACNYRDPYIYGDAIIPSYSLVSISANKSNPESELPNEKVLGGLPARNVFLAGDKLILPSDLGFHELYDTGTSTNGYFPFPETINCLCDNGELVYIGNDNGLFVADAPGFYGQENYLGDNDGSGYYQYQLETVNNRLLQVHTDTEYFDIGGGNYTTSFNHGVRAWLNDTYLGRFSLSYGYSTLLSWSDLAMIGDQIYLACNYGLYTSDTSTLADEPAATKIDIPAFNSMTQVGDRLYLADATNGVRILSVDDPLNPVDLGLSLDALAYNDLAVFGDWLYLREGTTLHTADITNPDLPVLTGETLTVAEGQLKVSENLLLVINDTQLAWYDLSSGAPVVFGATTAPFSISDAIVSGNGIYVADEMGICLIDLVSGDFKGRVMAKNTGTLAMVNQGIMAAQGTQSMPFFAPRDCSDIVPVFLMNCELVEGQSGSILQWETSSEASANEFRVEARCQTMVQDLEIIQTRAGHFQAAAPIQFTGEINFDLYHNGGGTWYLMSSRSYSPAPMPMRNQLAAIYPNPFNPQTEIKYQVGIPGPVTVVIYDLSGRRVAVLASGNHSSGEYTVNWTGRDDTGRTLASGSFVVRLESESGVDNRKLLMLR